MNHSHSARAASGSNPFARGSLARGRSSGVVIAIAAVFLWGCGERDSESGGAPALEGAGDASPEAAAPSAPKPEMLPTATDPCPALATGLVTVKGQQVQLWVGERREDHPAPVLFYWHGTGSVSAEASAYMASQIQEVVDEGGMVASFTTSMGTGQATGPFVWFSDDFQMADELLACAMDQLNVDTRRIYSAGCSAGGLQTSAMAYLRSGYIAAAMPNSGGLGLTLEMQDPNHVPPVITAHGAMGKDKVVIEFTLATQQLDADLVSKGGFVVNCDHELGHCGATPEVISAQWQFLKDHPYGVSPEPYADGLPSTFPSFCQIVR